MNKHIMFFISPSNMFVYNYIIEINIKIIIGTE